MNAADLFSGLGGTTTGAKAAGLRVAWCANHFAPAVQCHRANHPDVEHYEQDLGELDFRRVEPVDVLLASPSCRDFSEVSQPGNNGTGGSHSPTRDSMQARRQADRNTSWHVIDAVCTMQPQAVMVENVERFQQWGPNARTWDGSVFRAWLGCLQALGYATHVHTLNAADFGSPQERVRTIVTANRGAPIVIEPPMIDGPRIGDCLDLDGDHTNWQSIDDSPERMRWRMRKAQNEAGRLCFWANVSESRGRRLDERFPTSTTQSATQWQLLDGDRRRVLSAREMARTMSFPDSYHLLRNKKVSGYLVGNAFDVRMARHCVGEVIAA